VRWATRPGCHVDRTACAWLIRRFVDPAAEFLFVEELIDVPPDATPFDMRGAELSHHDGDCSFETFLSAYALGDPALERLARIIHEADLGDERFEAPEAPGIDLAVRALAYERDDDELLAVTEQLYDGLYAALREDLARRARR
jgi:hypothetical protein